MKKLQPFPYYGGKYYNLEWILGHLPKTKIYVEPFGGSGVVILSKLPSPIEFYSDLDGEVVNFFRVLREKPDELISQLALTPYSREEFGKACLLTAGLSDIERARQFFVRIVQTRSSVPNSYIMNWSYSVTSSHNGVAGNVSRWHGNIAGLKAVAERLLSIQIECLPAIKVIEKYDTPDTLFYCDPPYTLGSRVDSDCYNYEMSDKDHEELARVLHGIKGKVAISGYRGLMDSLYVDFFCYEHKPQVCHCSTKKSKRVEVLWTNYREGVNCGFNFE